MKSLLLLALLATVSLSCGAAPEPGARGLPATPAIEAIDAPPAEGDLDPPPRFALLGSAADFDVKLEGDDVILETETVLHRFAHGTWTSSPKHDDGAADHRIPGATTTYALPWTSGSRLLVGSAFDGSFDFRGDDAVTIPDMSALTLKPWIGDFPEIAFGTEPTTGHLYALASSELGDFGVFEWSAALGPSFTKLPMLHKPYAIYPVAVIVRSATDVWAFASTTSGVGFGPDFPGCGIIIRHAQDGAYVAHFDGQRWEEIAWPSKEHLDSAALAADGTIAIAAGWSEDVQQMIVMEGGKGAPQEHWKLDPATARFARSADPTEERARGLGWTIEDGAVRERGAVVALPDGDGDDERYVPSRVVAVTADDVFVLAKVLRGADDSGERVWLRTR